MRNFWLVVSLLAAVSFTPSSAHAQDSTSLKGKKKEKAPKLDLGLPAFQNIPKEQKLESSQGQPAQQLVPSRGVDENYTVVRLVHGRNFTRTPQGSKPATPLVQIQASGNPIILDGFSSVVRVKNAGKKSATIEMLVQDGRNDTVMSAEGVLRFSEGDEADWQVDWEPTKLRALEDLQVLVRVVGNPIGTFPLKVATSAK